MGQTLDGIKPVPPEFHRRILIVDDDAALLAVTAAALSGEGYEVLTATDGFEALAALRGGMPDVLISDLKMPNMSGFELLAVVRKRFPAIGVIAISGEFSPIGTPEGGIADRFLAKGDNSTFELLEIVRELIAEFPLRSQPARAEAAPVWLPRSPSGYLVLTCPMCLRSFSLSARQVETGVVVKEACVHCGGEVTYRIDATVATEAERLGSLEQTRRRLAASRSTLDETRKTIDQTKTITRR